HDPASVFVDLGVDEVAAKPPQPGQRSLLIHADQPTVASHVGGKDGGKPALGAFFGHASEIAFQGMCSTRDSIGAPSRSLSGPTSATGQSRRSCHLRDMSDSGLIRKCWLVVAVPSSH